MDLDQANKLWYELKQIEGVKFGYNDYVQIVRGDYSGNQASIISLISLEPVTYLAELNSDKSGDIYVLETELEETE